MIIFGEHDRLKISKKLILILVIAALVCGAAAYIAVTNSRFVTVEYSVASDRLPSEFDGFRVAQISDLHEKEWDGLAQAVADAKPDAILITGDLVSRGEGDVPRSLVSSLAKIAPTYFSPGNHEAERKDYPELRDELSALGVNVLEDSFVTLERGEGSIRIAGIVDPVMGFVKDDPEHTFQKELDSSLCKTVDGDGAFTVLMSHRPEYVMYYDAHCVDVVFAGHAHGGGIRLPFIGAIWAPGQGFMPAYSGGVYESEYSAVVVSRGLWHSTEPFRVNCPYELVICTLTQGQ